MKLSTLIASLKAISNNRQDLPIQVYDFKDIFQATSIVLEWEDDSYPSRFVLNTDNRFGGELGRSLTVKDLIDDAETLLQSLIKKLEREPNVLWWLIRNLEIEILLPDETQYTLANAVFDVKNQVCAITLGEIS